MRTRVIARSFYEDAYLGFFIRYYLDLGFDEIVILKSDADIFGGSTIPQYAIDSELITKEELDSGKIIIIPVENTGNNIIKENYHEYKTKSVDWVLSVDLDEFLVIDLLAYPNGINQYITHMQQHLYSSGKIPDPDDLQQLKFRWLCINKINCQYDTTQLPIVNMLDTDNLQMANLDMLDTPNSDIPLKTKPKFGLTLSDYMATNQLEIYSFVKSMAATKHMVDASLVNCHFFHCKKIKRPMMNTNNKNDGNDNSQNGVITAQNFMFIDGLRLVNNTYRSLRPPAADVTCRHGYILHLNTRSLANSLTKCLVTQLRDNKKIQDIDSFRQWIKSLNTNNYEYEYMTNSQNKTDICTKFMSYLGSKRYFPNKIKSFNKKYKDRIDIPSAVNMFKNAISSMPLSTQLAYVANLETEWAILDGLCKKHDLPFDKVRAVLELF